MDIASLLEVQMTEGESRENLTPREATPPVNDVLPSKSLIPAPISQEEKDFYKFMFGDDIASVRFRKLHCTACDVHIGSAPSKAYNMFEHPTLRTLLCARCHEFYGDGTFEQGEDATDMFCRWCANGGNLYCCSYCSNTFCNKCIKRNFDSLVRKKIEDDEKWKCFVCDPTDLYSARAVCWALLQHVQTVTSILRKDTSMSKDEVEGKMNLDESQCCTRRRKTKRRRTGSNSEEEDQTYVPTIGTPPIATRRKMSRKSASSFFSNGVLNHTRNTLSPLPTTSSPTTATSEYDDDDPPLPMIPCVQSMVECENETINTDNINVPSPPTPPPPNLEPEVLLPTMQLNPIPTAHLLKTVLTKSPATVTIPSRRGRPPGSQSERNYGRISNTSPQTIARRSPNTTKYTSTPFRQQVPQPQQQPQHQQQPQQQQQQQQQLAQSQQQSPGGKPMVKIPTQSTIPHRRARLILPKPQSSMMQSSGQGMSLSDAEQNVIEIDSDSDESVVVESSNIVAKPMTSSSERTPMETDTVLSPGLSISEKPSPFRFQDKSLSNTVEAEIASQNTDVMALLSALRAKIRRMPLMENSEKNELRLTRSKVRLFHHAVVRTIAELSDINDKVVHKYNNWRKSQLAEGSREAENGESKILDSLPLDMVCTRESESESEDEEDDMVVRDKVKSVKSFHERDTVDIAVGEPVQTEDKSVQAYDVVDRDYEKCIGHCVLTVVDYNASNEEVLKPVKVNVEHFGKFEEQFIFYLQHIEEHGIETEDVKGLPDPNETPLKDLIEANSPFISEMLESIGSPLTNGLRSGEVKQDSSEENSEDKENERVKKETGATNVVEELAKMVTELSDDLNASKQTDSDEQETNEEETQRVETEGKRKEDLNAKDLEEVDVAVKTLIEEDDRSKTSMLEETSTERVKRIKGDKSCVFDTDDECTIVD